MGLGQWIGLLLLALLLYILWQIRQIVLLVFTAVIFAVALNRLVRRFRRSGANRGVAVMLTLGIAIASLTCFGIVIFTPLTDQFQEFSQLVPQGIVQLQAWIDSLQARIPERFVNKIPPFNTLTDELQTLFTWITNQIYLLFSNSLIGIVNFLLVIVLTIMFAVNPMPYRRSLIQIFPAFYRQRVDEILSKCEQGLMGWLTGITLSMTFIGVTSWIGLWLLQVPLPLVNGILAGFLAFIPYVGAIFSVFPPMMLALLDAPWKAGAVLLLYFVIQQIEGNFVTPVIMEKKVSLLPAYTLALLTAFGWFFGFLGLFLALPILIIVQTWIQEVLIKDVLDHWQTAPQMFHKEQES